MVTTRVESLDWLRGLMATSIMFYHLVYWLFLPLDSSVLLGRLGVYGVSIFFVLSGLSMAMVYSKLDFDGRTSTVFYVKRIFRIWPLLWVCILLAIVPTLARGEGVSIVKVFLNLTTLFGFISPGDYINTGAWSIGNEMVYYALTPIVILIYKTKRLYGNLLLIVSFGIALVFSFYILDPTTSLNDQWHIYINPFNNFFLYVSGFAVFFNLEDVDIEASSLLILLVGSLAILSFYPVAGDKIAIVTGVNRILFLFSSVALVISFYKFAHCHLVPDGISYPLEQLGVATYGVYLLHPIVFMYAGYALKKLGMDNPVVLFFVVVVSTIGLSIASFHLFEKKVMKLGKRMALLLEGT